jgi:two-component system sensor histidine kinase YesM
MTMIQRLLFPFRRLSILKRLILIYIMFIFLPGVCTIYLYYQKSIAVNEQEMNESILKTLYQSSINISYHLNNISQATDIFFSKRKIYNYLDWSERYEAYEHLHEFIELIELITNVQDYPDVFKIRIFIDPKLPFSRENIHFFPLTLLQQQSWYPEIVKQNGSVFWKSTYQPQFSNELPIPVLSAARVIRDPNNYDHFIGVLMIDITEEKLYESIQSIKLDIADAVYVMDENGVVIAHTDKFNLGRNMSDVYDTTLTQGKDEGFFKYRVDDKDNYILYTTIPSTQWKVVADIPVSKISTRNRELTRTSGILVMAATFIVFLLLIVLSFGLMAESVSKRIGDLIRMMRKDGMTHIDERLRFGFTDIRLLEHSIRNLIGAVNTMAEESYRAKLQEREAQLRALQSQINPHFLYNTLETINWMAIRRKAGDISSLINALSTYFRLTLNKGRDFVTVHDEVRLAQAYLDIQSSRFENKFETVFDVEPGAELLIMPKLTLQPIIENALLHGIRKKRNPEPGLITIRIYCEHKDVIVTITDNGAGIPESVLKHIMSSSLSKDSMESYGLYNVHERIRLYCGDAYGLTVHSEEGRGTEVSIRMKAIQQTGQNELTGPSGLSGQVEPPTPGETERGQ